MGEAVKRNFEDIIIEYVTAVPSSSVCVCACWGVCEDTAAV
jgi:hypothetical protein